MGCPFHVHLCVSFNINSGKAASFFLFLSDAKTCLQPPQASSPFAPFNTAPHMSFPIHQPVFFFSFQRPPSLQLLCCKKRSLSRTTLTVLWKCRSTFKLVTGMFWAVASMPSVPLQHSLLGRLGIDATSQSIPATSAHKWSSAPMEQ